jgi:hypothetical protein
MPLPSPPRNFLIFYRVSNNEEMKKEISMIRANQNNNKGIINK